MEPTRPKLIKNFPAFYGTPKFIHDKDVALRILQLQHFFLELRKQQAQLLQKYDNKDIPNNGKGETLDITHQCLILGSCIVCDSLSDQAVIGEDALDKT